MGIDRLNFSIKRGIIFLLFAQFMAGLVACFPLGQADNRLSNLDKLKAFQTKKKLPQLDQKDIDQLLNQSDQLIWGDEAPSKEVEKETTKVVQRTKESLLNKHPELKYWHRSYQVARNLANKQQKPLLIWFSNSRDVRTKPVEQDLVAEVFLQSQFSEWAKAEIVGVRLDKGFKVNKEFNVKKKREYITSLETFLR